MVIFTISALLFVSQSIYIYVMLTFEFNHEFVGDILCNIYFFYFISEQLFLDWIISAAFIISLFRCPMNVRQSLIIIGVLSCLAMASGIKITSFTTLGNIGGRNVCVFFYGYDVFNRVRIFVAYVNFFFMVGFLFSKILQKYWRKFNIFNDKINRLYLVLFISYWLHNVSEFNWMHEHYEVIVFLFYFIYVNTWIILCFFDDCLYCEIKKILPCCKTVTLEYVTMTELDA